MPPLEPPHPLLGEVAGKKDAGRAQTTLTELPELVIFQAFAGNIFDRPRGTAWQQFYLDPRLFRWMIVEGKRIRYCRRIEDKESPTGGCDYIWVETDALVGSGSGTEDREAPFLTGDFTRAGDFEASSAGGTQGSTGEFFGVRTPLCDSAYCYRPRTRY